MFSVQEKIKLTVLYLSLVGVYPMPFVLYVLYEALNILINYVAIPIQYLIPVVAMQDSTLRNWKTIYFSKIIEEVNPNKDTCICFVLSRAYVF